jgi:hypothetical protein
MTVYVDNMAAEFGRMKMCHCWADTREELFAMMQKIDVKLKWFQRPPGVCDFGMPASWEHFDISVSKRKLAIAAGAVEVDMLTMAEHANKQKFIRALTRGDFNAAKSCLEIMCMTAAARERRK